MSSSQDSDPRHSWYRGAAISALGVLIGTIAFGTFCYAFGLNFSDEGWSDSHDQPWQTHRTQLIGSLIGFTIAILLFWLGFIQITRSRS